MNNAQPEVENGCFLYNQKSARNSAQAGAAFVAARADCAARAENSQMIEKSSLFLRETPRNTLSKGVLRARVCNVV